MPAKDKKEYEDKTVVKAIDEKIAKVDLQLDEENRRYHKRRAEQQIQFEQMGSRYDHA